MRHAARPPRQPFQVGEDGTENDVIPNGVFGLGQGCCRLALLVLEIEGLDLDKDTDRRLC